MYTKINKRKARKLYENDGLTIILAPKNCNPASIFALQVNKGMMGMENFDALVNAFRYYNGPVSYWVA